MPIKIHMELSILVPCDIFYTLIRQQYQNIEKIIQFIKIQNTYKMKKTAQQRQYEQTKDKLISLLQNMEETIKLIPRKGDRPFECQRSNISNYLGGLDHCINGLVVEDFTPNEYSGDFKFSYS